MTVKLNRRAFVAAASAAASTMALAKPTLAGGHTVHEVQMLNKHPEDPRARQVFYPRIQVVKPGDAVSFVATDKGHNSASIEDMLPADAEGWDGRINQDIEVTFNTPGFYGYQCTPHATAGMVGLVIVEGEGMMDNLEAAQGVRQRGKARDTWEDIWAEVEEMEFEMTS